MKARLEMQLRQAEDEAQALRSEASRRSQSRTGALGAAGRHQSGVEPHPGRMRPSSRAGRQLCGARSHAGLGHSPTLQVHAHRSGHWIEQEVALEKEVHKAQMHAAFAVSTD